MKSKYLIQKYYGGFATDEGAIVVDTIVVDSYVNKAASLRPKIWQKMLTDQELENMVYFRVAIVSDNRAYVDYGNWSYFIKIQKIKEVEDNDDSNYNKC